MQLQIVAGLESTLNMRLLFSHLASRTVGLPPTRILRTSSVVTMPSTNETTEKSAMLNMFTPQTIETF
jgi:hypothetical protein